MSLVNKIAVSLYAKRYKAMDYYRKHPDEVQEKLFKNLIKTAAGTEFGKQYGFSSINNIAAYQSRVPIQEYDDIMPLIDRMRGGEQNILWPTPVKWFAKSSGTTGSKSKFIPITHESLNGCHFRGSRDVVLTHIRQFSDSKLLLGKSLTLGGSHKIDDLNKSVKSGDLSAILIQNAPFYANIARVPKKETALISDFETKLDRIAKETAKANIVSFAGVPSWNLVLMRHILDYAGKSNLLELWPNLELFMHGGISFGPYREQFQEIIPSPKMRYRETYNASEGFFALQDDLTDPSMQLIMDTGMFYEFVPLSELYTDNPTAYTVADVKTGVSYALIISTNSGLWRYVIGDTVEFTSLYPHKIKITGRTKHFINVFGEELMVHNAEKALAATCDKTGAIVKEYTVAPIFMEEKSKGSHEWLVEFEREPKDLNQFAEILDAELCSLNSDYEAKRAKSVTLNRLTLTPLPRNTFYEWMRQRGKLGGQNKVPRLFNTRQYADELLAITADSDS